MTIKMTGIKEIDRALSKLDSPGSIRKVARQSLRKGAKLIQQKAKENAPVDESKQTKKNIKIRSGKRSRTEININVEVSAKDFADDYYAAFVEYSVAGGESTKSKGWMRGTFDEKSKHVTKAIEKMIVRGVEEEIKRLASK